MNLIGTLTNPKHFSLDDKIFFWDAMDMVSPQSLQTFCKSMDVRGKDDGSLMFEITNWDDFNRIKLDQDKFQAMKNYCIQDVKCMKDALLKFNQLIINCVKLIRGNSYNHEKLDNLFILEKTMAKLSFDLFNKFFIPQFISALPIEDQHLYNDIGLSYRGGFV